MASILNATTSSGLVTSADNSGSLQLATNNGTAAVTIDTSQNVGIGTASPTGKLTVSAGANEVATFISTVDTNADLFVKATGTTLGSVRLRANGNDMVFIAGLNERARINSSGEFLIGCTGFDGDRPNVAGGTIKQTNGNTKVRVVADGTAAFQFYSVTGGGTPVGAITPQASSTTYATSSDYRLKENVAPMVDALAKVSALKPVTYTWKSTGEASQGFIAHELQEVVPDCVVGEKDAVDAEGNAQYQGIDTSFLVATLTAAIQELNAKVDAQALEIQALKGVA
jgi:hypothetical protein